jgi:hypothetical protein
MSTKVDMFVSDTCAEYECIFRNPYQIFVFLIFTIFYVKRAKLGFVYITLFRHHTGVRAQVIQSRLIVS